MTEARSPLSSIMQERLAVLDGSAQSNSYPRAAVRVRDLQALLLFSPAQQSQHAAGEVVTPEEFNALVDDVSTIFAALSALSTALQARLVPG